MAGKKIALSIVIPTYQCEAFFEETLRYLLSVRPEGFEIVLADDGSTDGTRAILRAYEGKYPDLTILYCEHGGVSAARNAGLGAARGEYVTFLDCDDCLHEGFLTEERLRFSENADLYVFGMERQTLDGKREQWTLEDRRYPDASDFADDYIRRHKLLLYSVANKLYRREIIDRLGLRFREGLQFGEDRLFNFRYLEGCGSIIASSEIMQDYIQRSDSSLSHVYKPGYFGTVLALHQAKMDCILGLSKGTTEREKREYIAYDLTREISLTIDRFSAFPEEKEESVCGINALIFGGEHPLLPPEELESLSGWQGSEQGRLTVLGRVRERIVDGGSAVCR